MNDSQLDFDLESTKNASINAPQNPWILKRPARTFMTADQLTTESTSMSIFKNRKSYHPSSGRSFIQLGFSMRSLADQLGSEPRIIKLKIDQENPDKARKHKSFQWGIMFCRSHHWNGKIEMRSWICYSRLYFNAFDTHRIHWYIMLLNNIIQGGFSNRCLQVEFWLVKTFGAPFWKPFEAERLES